MGDVIKWVVLAILGWLVFNWLRNGVNFSAQASPNGWGSGMMYAPGASWMNGLSPYQPSPFSYSQAHSIFANYSPQSQDFTFAAGF